MQNLINNIRSMALLALAFFAMTSCVYEDVPDDFSAPDNSPLLNIGMQLPGMRADAGGAPAGYEPGVGYENYINIKNKGYRIYFFDSANKYIASFVPLFVNEKDAESDIPYEVVGRVPGDVLNLTEFKIVVLANWPTYPADTDLIQGITTIDALCNAETAQFDCLPGFVPNPDKGMLIPFFGVHHYTNVAFKEGRTTLAEPVALLRAVAKVEIVVDIDNVSMRHIGIRGFNTKGYCAPQGVNSQSDYDHGGAWETDYVQAPHLVNDENDSDQGNAVLPMFQKYESDETHKETWVAYVPEYRNRKSGERENYRSYIEFKLDIQDDREPAYPVYFADYDENGKMVADSYFDIWRNNCYRFTISIRKGGFAIKVLKWDHAYDNHFSFE